MTRAAKIVPFMLGIWLLGATLARSFRFPNEFAKAHWVIDYRFGFIKRGFIGSVITILSRFGIISKSENSVILLSFAIIIVLYTLFFLVAWSISRKTNWDEYSYCILYILMTSPFVVTSGHFFGYFDAIIIAISFICTWLIIHRKIAACSLLSIIAVLIHENYLIIGLPLMLFAVYMIKEHDGYPKRKLLYPVFAVITTFLILFISENLFTDRNQLRVSLESQFINSGFIDTGWSKHIAIWITTSMVEYLRSQMSFFYPRILNTHTTLMILPSVLAMLLFIYERFEMPHRQKGLLFALYATLAPLLLHLIAWDTQRISAYTIVIAFGCVWICAETLPPVKRLERPSLIAQAVLGSALVANCFMRLPLMLGETDGVSMSIRAGLYAPVFITLLLYYLRWSRRHGAGSQA